MKWNSMAAYGLCLTQICLFTACLEDDDVPPAENSEEVITDVTLTFTPEGGGTPVTATWVDADGEGSGDPVLTDITLVANTTYTLRLELTNALDPADPEDITQEIEEEADEHMLFYGWTNGLFLTPTGDGNIDNRADPVNYEDQDGSGLPLGLVTGWTTNGANTGTFRVILKHQPTSKSATSTTSDGTTDMDITWDITIQ